MALFKLVLKPGIDKQNTEYGAEGGYIDGDYIRFRYGLPEKMGGWTQFSPGISLVGQVSAIYTWVDLTGIPHAIAGTNRKLYVFKGGTWYDITPIRDTTDPGDVTFAATSGQNLITVTDIDHGAIAGDFVTFSGAVSLGGNITTAILNSEFQIQEVLNSSTYTILSPVAANASDIGNGGAAVVGEYQITVGSDKSYFDFGWGVSTWGAETWGTPRTVSDSVVLQARVWQLDGYGEDVICQVGNGGTYLFDTSVGPVQRAQIVSGAPTKSKFALVSTPDRHLVCFGTETIIGDETSQDLMFVRFSSQEDINQFEESATNTAGGQRLSDGSEIISAIRSRGQILIFTDSSLHGMQFIGPPFTFGFQQLGSNCGIAGPHSAIDVNGTAFWMGLDSFYLFDGVVKEMPCSVQDYVFKDMNTVQRGMFHVGHNSNFNEITWWYCSFTSDYVDRFVTYNYLEGTWSIGSMARTAWTDIDVYPKPLGAKYDENDNAPVMYDGTIYGITAGRSIVYNQEDGFNADGEPIQAHLQSGYFDIEDGDNMLFMKRFVPDFKNQVGNLTVQLLLRPYPQATASPSSLDPYVITPTTQKVDTRARGRQISMRIESDELGSHWRFGTMRVDVQPDGLR